MILNLEQTVVPTDRGIEILSPDKRGNLRIRDLKARSLTPQTINRFEKIFSYTNNSEGYLVQIVAGDRCRLIGSWVYGEEIVTRECRVFGHDVKFVEVETPITPYKATQRPSLKVVGGRDYAKSYSVA